MRNIQQECQDIVDPEGAKARNDARGMEVLKLIARWWEQGGASLSPDALLGESDRSIRELVEDATGIRR